MSRSTPELAVRRYACAYGDAVRRDRFWGGRSWAVRTTVVLQKGGNERRNMLLLGPFGRYCYLIRHSSKMSRTVTGSASKVEELGSKKCHSKTRSKVVSRTDLLCISRTTIRGHMCTIRAASSPCRSTASQCPHEANSSTACG